MPDTTYRLIDTDGSEIGMITDPRSYIPEDDVVRFEGAAFTVLDVYDNEDGREGGVRATLVVDVAWESHPSGGPAASGGG